MESQTKPNTRNFDLIKGGILLVLVILLVVAIDRSGDDADAVTTAPTAVGTAAVAGDGTPQPNLTPGVPALAPPIVKDDGGVTFTGTGAPGTTVEIWANGEKVGDVIVSEGGTWVYESAPPPGDYQVVVVARDADGNVLEQSSAIGVTVPEAGSGPPQISTTPPEATATPGPGDSSEEKSPEIVESEVSETGEVTVSGTGEPGSTVVIYENGVEVTTVQVEADGTFTVTYASTSEEHVFEVQPEGSEPTDDDSSSGGESSEPATPTPTPTLVPVPSGGMDYIVQPGEWLMDLARKFYGDPARWVDIYVATNTKATLDFSYAFLSDPNFVVAGWKIFIPPR